ncbi:MAG: hypothetical protein ABIL49_07345 [candidate division WOR-3 bacterium]|jgi:predicted negative regulator of RcsB-dependent stress response
MDIKNILNLIKARREQIIFVLGIIIVAIIIFLYNSLSSKRANADSQVNFIQGFYAIQFGDTLNAPKILTELYSRNKSNFVGFWAGLTLADYYYKLERKDNTRSILKNIKPSDKIGEIALNVLNANIKADLGNIKGAISDLNKKTGFNSIDNYIAYKKAKLLLISGNKNEAIKILKELSKGEGAFSEIAKQELKALGEKL